MRRKCLPFCYRVDCGNYKTGKKKWENCIEDKCLTQKVSYTLRIQTDPCVSLLSGFKCSHYHKCWKDQRRDENEG